MKCPNCGSDIIVGQKFCTHCGFNLEEYFIKMTQQNNSTNQPTSSVTNSVPIEEPQVQYQSTNQNPNNNINFNQQAPQTQNTNTIDLLIKNNVPYLVVVGILTVLFYLIGKKAALIPLLLGLGYMAYEYFGKQNSESNVVNDKIKTMMEAAKAQNNSDLSLDKQQKNLLVIGSGAGIVHLIAIIFLPFIAISSMITPFISQITSAINEFSDTDGMGNSFLQMIHGGDLSIANINSLSNKVKPFLESSQDSEMGDIATYLDLVPIAFYTLTALMLIVIAMFFIKKYASIVFIVAGSISTMFYVLIYLFLQGQLSDLVDSTELNIAPSAGSFIGLGFHLGLIASIVLITVGVIGLVKYSNNTKKGNITNVQA